MQNTVQTVHIIQKGATVSQDLKNISFVQQENMIYLWFLS